MSNSSSNKPHIAQFIDSMDPGGAEEVVVNLSRGMVDRGYPVTIFHFGNPSLQARIAQEGFSFCELGNQYYKSILTLPMFVVRFCRILREHKIDVLHAHLLGAIFAGAFSARLARIPFIGTIHDTYSLHESSLHPKYLAWASKSGGRLVVVADSMQREVAKSCGLKTCAVDRIYNGIRLERFCSSDRPRDRDTIVQVVTVARAVAVKRLDLLLEVIARIEPDLEFRLVVVGDGPLLSGLQDKAVELQVDNKVKFLGHRTDVPKILANSDIYTLVSDSEGLSMSLLESMAAGLPSVVTDVGGNGELVSDSESGYVAPAGDVEALSKYLTLLINSSRQRRDFGEIARQRAEASFSVAAMTESYIKLIGIGSPRHA